jgi:hypothetical protein
MISRSITRSVQRCPRLRPNAASIAFSRASNSGGLSSLSTSAAALTKRRRAGPSGAVATSGDVMTTPPIAASAARTSSAGVPWRPRRLEPKAMT